MQPQIMLQIIEKDEPPLGHWVQCKVQTPRISSTITDFFCDKDIKIFYENMISLIASRQGTATLSNGIDFDLELSFHGNYSDGHLEGNVSAELFYTNESGNRCECSIKEQFYIDGEFANHVLNNFLID